jgi:nicotinate dehydrogenase subunit A
MASVTVQVNGAASTFEVTDPDTPLLYVLRNDLALTGTKFGCGLGQCGACTVQVDGQAVRSCSMPVSAVVGRQITTIEGLGSPDKPDPVQAAFIAEQALQCGYCTAGLVMTARAFLQQNRRPTESEVKQALAGNLCRCGSHVRVIRAVMRAAATMGGA